MISLRSTLRSQVGQKSGILMRELQTSWIWFKEMRSLRAAAKRRTGMDKKPKLRKPFQTEVAIVTPGRYISREWTKLKDEDFRRYRLKHGESGAKMEGLVCGSGTANFKCGRICLNLKLI